MRIRITRRAASLGLLGAAFAPGALAQAPPPGSPGALVQAPPPGSPDDPRPRTYERIGQPGAAFAFEKLGGGVAQLSDYRGQALILYFGGLWCPDCVADGANVNALARRAENSTGVAFLNIYTHIRFGRWGGNDQSELTPEQAQAAMRAYFAETGYSYPVAFNPSRAWAREHYAIAWYPTFLLLDGQGVIRAWRTDLGADGAASFLAEARRLVGA